MIRYLMIACLAIHSVYALDLRCEFHGNNRCYLPRDQQNEDFEKVTTLTVSEMLDEITDDFVLSTITRDSLQSEFFKFPNVEYFWLSVGAYELTTALSHLALDTWHHLRVFNLSMNRIRAIPSQAFVNNVGADFKLEIIDFSSNLLEDINSKAFTDLTTLRTLRLDFNRIRNLKNGLFIGVSNVQILNLSCNHIATIDDRVFELVALERLELQNNSLTTLPTNLFAHSPNLKYLDLSSNPLASNFEEVVVTAKHLRNLQLNNLPIDSVVDLETFMDLSDLQTLSLVNTYYISASISNPSTSQLSELNLFSSNINNLATTEEILKDLSTLFPTLTVLYINGNIKEIESNYVRGLFPHLKTLHGADTTVSLA